MGKYSDMITNDSHIARRVEDIRTRAKYSTDLLGFPDGVQTPTAQERMQAGLTPIPMDSPHIRGQEVNQGEGADFLTNLKAGFVDDPQTKLKVYAKARFPDLPEKEALDRVGMTKTGDIVYLGDDDKLYTESPRGGSNVFNRLAANTLAHSPSIALSTIGAGTPAAPVLAPLGAAGGEGIRKSIGNLFFDEPQTVKGNVMSMGLEGGIVGGSLLLAHLAKTGYNRHAVKDITKLDQRATGDLQNKFNKFGIDSTPAELTNLPSLKAQQKALNNLTASADKMDDFYTKRSGQVEKAVTGLFDDVSPVDDATRAGFMSRKAAQGALDDEVMKRSAKAKPFYNKSFKTDNVDVSGLINQIDEKLNMAKGRIKTSLNKTKSLLHQNSGKYEHTIQGLHNAKMELDDMISVAQRKGEKYAVKELMDVKRSLLQTMDDASPDYKTARKIFAGESRSVDQLDKSIVKVISSLKDKDIQKAATTAFNPKTSSPHSIELARKAIESQDPKAWRAITRSYMQDVWEDASKEFVNANKNARGAKFRAALFGDVKKKRILKAALGNKQYEQLRDLMDVLEATGRVKPIGSDTAWNTEVMNQIRQERGGKLRTLLTPHKLLNRIADRVEDYKVGKYANGLADIITSPDAMKKLKDLKTLSPHNQKRLYQTATLFGVSIYANQ